MNGSSRLVKEVLRWWEAHQYDCVSDGEDERNVYSDPPEFVRIAISIVGNKKRR